MKQWFAFVFQIFLFYFRDRQTGMLQQTYYKVWKTQLLIIVGYGKLKIFLPWTLSFFVEFVLFRID